MSRGTPVYQPAEQGGWAEDEDQNVQGEPEEEIEDEPDDEELLQEDDQEDLDEDVQMEDRREDEGEKDDKDLEQDELVGPWDIQMCVFSLHIYRSASVES